MPHNESKNGTAPHREPRGPEKFSFTFFMIRGCMLLHTTLYGSAAGCRSVCYIRKDVSSRIFSWLHSSSDCNPRYRDMGLQLLCVVTSGLQKMFSLSGTIKSNGQNFLSNMCMKHTPQAHSVKSLWAGFRPRAFWRSLVQSAPIFEPFLCKYYYFLFLVLNILCGVNFFLGPAVPRSCGFCRPELHWHLSFHKFDVKYFTNWKKKINSFEMYIFKVCRMIAWPICNQCLNLFFKILMSTCAQVSKFGSSVSCKQSKFQKKIHSKW